MKKWKLIDFCLGIAVLYDYGANGKEIQNFAKRVRCRMPLCDRVLVDLCINSKDINVFMKRFFTIMYELGLED